MPCAVAYRRKVAAQWSVVKLEIAMCLLEYSRRDTELGGAASLWLAAIDGSRFGVFGLD